MTGERLRGSLAWSCICDCGSTKIAITSDLTRTRHPIRSCGCLSKDKNVIHARTRSGVTHGMSKHPIYSHWLALIKRCRDKHNASYRNYGAIGITPCAYIESGPEALRAILGVKPTKSHSVDRINNSLGYNCGACDECKSLGHALNIRWATTYEQAHNRSTNTLVEINGIIKCAAQWAHDIGISNEAFYQRLKSGRLGLSLLEPLR